MPEPFFAYSQRKHGERGIWLAVVKPTESQFTVECNQIVWRAETTTQTDSPLSILSGRTFRSVSRRSPFWTKSTVFVTLWCVQPSGRGIRYVRLRIVK